MRWSGSGKRGEVPGHRREELTRPMGNLITWLFTDPLTACSSVTAANKVCAAISTSNGTQYVEVFRFYLPWIIFCALGLLIPLYYAAEGRRRFVKGNMLLKRNMDRVMKQLAWVAGIGWLIMGARYAMDSSFFAWRFWRYAWLAWAVALVIYWGVYLVRRFPAERKQYRDYMILSQYVPEPRNKRTKGVAKAGSR
jgi:hypothetical protein